MQVYRHRLITRIWHWVNALAVLVMIPSGLMIFNAHPRLYWGNYGANFDHAWLSLPRWPGWLTLPSTYDLAGARHWHLFFALVLAFSLLIYLLWSLANRHLQRDLRFRRDELSAAHLAGDLRRIGRCASTIRRTRARTISSRRRAMPWSCSCCCRC